MIVLGMSAGGLEPLRTVLAALPREFPACMVVAAHVSRASNLAPLLQSWTGCKVSYASHGAPLRASEVFVCPAQRHLTINPDASFAVSSKERVSFVRPCIDWLFEAAAATYNERAMAVLLSGANNDGTRGARRVAKNGGFVIVQDPDTARWPPMPRSAIRAGIVHARLAPTEIMPALIERMRLLERMSTLSWTNPFDELAQPAMHLIN